MILLISNSFYLPLLKAQPTESTRALRIFQKGIEAFQEGRWDNCEKEMLKAIAVDSAFADAHIMLGDVYLETRRPERAVESYRRALRFNPDRAFIVNNLLANTLYDLERYPEACAAYEAVLNDPEAPAGLKDILEQKYFICKKRRSLIENPVNFVPVNLGAGVNSIADEYVNAISTEGDVLYFTRKEKTPEDQLKGFYETFYKSKWTGSEWGLAEKLGYPPGTEQDAGALCISPDGLTIYFTACFRPDSYGSCDLYYSDKQGDEWSEPRNMGADINSDHWDAQPSISPDGNTLYFASNRKGGVGSADIWKTERTADGGWGKPVNLGRPVNTAEVEMAPFIHYDNTTLYFSSAGHPGLGGQDLFLTRRSGDQWSKPQNLGYPLNSSADELIIIINSTGTKGYISIDDEEGEGGFDIYAFDLYPEIMPLTISDLKAPDMPAAAPVAVGSKIVLRNILYETDKYKLLPESFAELDILVQFLEENPGVRIEIGGHTDDEGTAEYNLDLSGKRAGTVYDYLISKGISEERLTYKGFGESQPVSPNDTPEGRALNRRTEIRIIGMD
ncbi:MAG: OmpA family protein [Bacteroidales bacterium]